MFENRIKIFVTACAVFLLLCVFRLMQMQLLKRAVFREKIAELKLEHGRHRQLKTIRGKILDRNDRILADNRLGFQLHIYYRLTCFWDERVRWVEQLKASQRGNSQKLERQIEDRLEDLKLIIDKCEQFGLDKTQIEAKIRTLNEKVWTLRTFLAWARNKPDPAIIEEYGNRITAVPAKVAISDFNKKFHSEEKRIRLISDVSVEDVDQSLQLLELKTDGDIFTAQLEFSGIDGVKILPQTQRVYKYGSVAAQTIGWVGPAQPEDEKLFGEDRLLRYLAGEVCGREDGTEYVCEAILRGKRGQLVYDIDQRLRSHSETKFGQDVKLTLDIELQKEIEQYIANCNYNYNCNAPMSAVVIDVVSGDILALVSKPGFDLNRVRFDYGRLATDSNQPLLNRALNAQYPPGSAIKPVILIAALESGKIRSDEIINCPARNAARGWPNCWIFNRQRIGHDDKWPNIARNALKGSCNVYFSRLAERIEPVVLQRWLYDFGFGRKLSLAPTDVNSAKYPRDFRQLAGVISSGISKGQYAGFEEIPALKEPDRRWFGIGQGDLRVTPLQVANMMATIARGGLYRQPRLFIDDEVISESVSLDISPETLEVVLDGLNAVVNESGGTAESAFSYADFAGQGVTVYGKTGSTEKPYNAWFAGFAEDQAGRSVAVALVIEGGQHGSTDACPPAREIIRFCIEAGYIGWN